MRGEGRAEAGNRWAVAPGRRVHGGAAPGGAERRRRLGRDFARKGCMIHAGARGGAFGRVLTGSDRITDGPPTRACISGARCGQIIHNCIDHMFWRRTYPLTTADSLDSHFDYECENKFRYRSITSPKAASKRYRVARVTANGSTPSSHTFTNATTAPGPSATGSSRASSCARLRRPPSPPRPHGPRSSPRPSPDLPRRHSPGHPRFVGCLFSSRILSPPSPHFSGRFPLSLVQHWQSTSSNLGQEMPKRAHKAYH